jgi:hypothetical protein
MWIEHSSTVEWGTTADANHHGKAFISGVLTCRHAVGVAQYVGVGVLARAARHGGSNVEVLAIPQRVGCAAVALVEESAGVDPVPGVPSEPVDTVLSA